VACKGAGTKTPAELEVWNRHERFLCVRLRDPLEARFFPLLVEPEPLADELVLRRLDPAEPRLEPRFV
jgi:hypothetical protein